ncbi:hypothetical protein C2G38_2051388 [Gigaspora rosea]|uniref:Uncharacterized protein n=1 Tax=Gigaspora rosea TaxID=44941 RepID=A0A397TRZ6_9GLOM|nr:hypothetical protein C2G38_2051388 [Gigaspora rosea]
MKIFKQTDNKFDNEIEATSITNRRTYTRVINDKHTNESTYITINKEATDNFENEDNLEEQFRFEKTYTTIHNETTNSSSNVNIEEQLFEPELNFENEDNLEEQLRFEKTYTTIHNETTNPSSNVNIEEQLFEPELAYIIINNKATRSEVNLEELLLRSVDQKYSYISVFDTDSSDKESDNTFSALTLGQTFITWDDAEKSLDRYGLEKGFSI